MRYESNMRHEINHQLAADVVGCPGAAGYPEPRYPEPMMKHEARKEYETRKAERTLLYCVLGLGAVSAGVLVYYKLKELF